MKITDNMTWIGRRVVWFTQKTVTVTNKEQDSDTVAVARLTKWTTGGKAEMKMP